MLASLIWGLLAVKCDLRTCILLFAYTYDYADWVILFGVLAFNLDYL